MLKIKKLTTSSSPLEFGRKMMHHSKKPTIMIFSPHIDDKEFGLPFFYINMLKLGFNVIEVIMTNGELGTHELEFKGKRLKKIRIHELEKSIEVFTYSTKNQTHVIRMNYLDGHLPLNKDVVTNVLRIIREKSPDLIFAPDPWYILDHHSDHLNTGTVVFLALKQIEASFLPKKVFYYYTFSSDHFFQVHWKNKEIIFEAYDQFKSQVSPLQKKFLKFIYLYLYFRRYFKSGDFTENFREQPIIKNKVEYPKKLKLLQKFKYHFYRSLTFPKAMQFQTLTPKEIGLE
jgi:LmbE family N-acetylglucosaminyl deacetylase